MARPSTAAWAGDALPAMTHDLRTLVELETPSNDKALLDAGLDAIHCLLADRLGTPGTLYRHHGGPHGDLLEVSYPGELPGFVLLLCHYDTVWPKGTLARWPFELRGNRASGPGTFDMKLGLVQAVWAVRCAKDLGLALPTVTLLLTGDEEIGSPAGRPHIERLSEGALATLVFEASLDGALKTGRKGVGLFDLTVRGVEAHAGLEPGAGVSAVHQLAELVPVIAGLADPALGTSVNVGLIAGGTGRNVVAGEATCGIDVRIAIPEEAARIDAAFAALTPSHPGATLALGGGWNRPPMVPNPASQRLFKLAHAVAADLGFRLGEVTVGGASDANFVAALGRAVLDGLGAVGAGAHARHEHVLLDQVPLRTALVTGLLTALG